MLIGRLIGWIAILAAVFVAIWDGVTWQQTGTYPFSPGGQVWYQIHPDSLNLLQAGVQRHMSPEIWDLAFQPVLLWPAIATLSGVGLILLVLFRRR